MSNSKKALFHAIRKGDAAVLAELRDEGETLSLAGETFKGAQIIDCEFFEIDFSNTEWDECSLDRVTFRDCNLDGAYFTGTMMLGCAIRGGTMEGGSLEGCVMKNCELEATQVEASEFSDLQLSDCVLADLDLVDVDWRNIVMNAGTIRGVGGSSGTLAGITLRQVELESFDTSELTVENCTTTPLAEVPAGFVAREGRRRRV